jgi:hypothetical protein
MKSRLASVVLLVLAVGVAAVSVWPVWAQEGRAQRWEYCRLGKPSLGAGPAEGEYIAQVVYYTAQGGKVETVRRTGPKVAGDSGWTVRMQAIAKLGTEGWELVTSQGDEMIFKRRLP